MRGEVPAGVILISDAKNKTETEKVKKK